MFDIFENTDTHIMFSISKDGWLPLVANLTIVGLTLLIFLAAMAHPHRIKACTDWIKANLDKVTPKQFTHMPLWLHSVCVFFICAILLVIAWLSLMALWRLFETLGDFKLGDNEPKGDAIRGLAFALGALIGLPFLVWRSWVAQRQADIAKDQADIAEQGLITDRFTKAVEQLGADKSIKKDDTESTVPNIEVRLGALFALERIAQDSKRDHIPIMETICAYIRENTKAQDYIAVHQHSPREDIQTALTILARRSAARCDYERDTTDDKPAYALDLRGVYIVGADMTKARFAYALFTNANLIQAGLNNANLREAKFDCANLIKVWLNDANLTLASLNHANLTEARLYDANLTQARFRKANLTEARLDRVNLRAATLNDANLTQARLDGAILTKAHLNGTKLIKARLDRADLTDTGLCAANLTKASLFETTLSGAEFIDANLKEAILFDAILPEANFLMSSCRHLMVSSDLSKVVNLAQEQIDQMFGDANTNLSAGHVRPHHWPKEEIEYREHFEAWQAHIKNTS